METKIENNMDEKFNKYCQLITDFISKNKDYMYVTEPCSAMREKIHKYIKNKYSTIISRSEYMAHGLERYCCGKWHKSTEYGKSWNGGTVTCSECNEDSYCDYSDCEDVIHDDSSRCTYYKPTGNILICKAGYKYKRHYKYPFSFRKHYTGK